MKLFEEMNLPPIPAEYHEEILWTIDHDPEYLNGYGFIKRFDCPTRVIRFIRENIAMFRPDAYKICVQLLDKDLPMHVDLHLENIPGRINVYNFVVTRGGTSVRNKFFNEDGSLIEEHPSEQHKWYRISSWLKHSVDGISGRRVSVVVAKDHTTKQIERYIAKVKRNETI